MAVPLCWHEVWCSSLALLLCSGPQATVPASADGFSGTALTKAAAVPTQSVRLWGLSSCIGKALAALHPNEMESVVGDLRPEAEWVSLSSSSFHIVVVVVVVVVLLVAVAVAVAFAAAAAGVVVVVVAVAAVVVAVAVAVAVVVVVVVVVRTSC